MKFILFLISVVFFLRCSSLTPVVFNGNGGYFKHYRHFYDGKNASEMESVERATTYCRTKGFSNFKITETKEDEKFSYRYFVCSEKTH